ncbi:MAG: AIR carboxylase family protein [Aquificaceae bacterium]|nr:AIR carboxylase family protein [Aquificaceae bacterium]
MPVATVGIGNGTNAGLLAVRILSLKHGELQEKLIAYQASLRQKVEDMNLRLSQEL